MESRLFCLLLAAVCMAGCARQSVRSETGAEIRQVPVIEPEVARREIRAPRIDTEDFEIGMFVGQLSVEDFGVNPVVGVRFAYHVSESLFLELAAGSTETSLTSFERLSGAAQLLTDAERRYDYYNLSVGYNLFPGESFFGRDRAWNSAVYLVGGVGSTSFAGDDRFTVSLGAGWRILPLDWLAIHADVRDHIFDIDLLGQQNRAHNLEAHVGVTFFF